MLDYYGMTDYYSVMKEWYDGYHFGNVDVYCPWDVINYCDLLIEDSGAAPQDLFTDWVAFYRKQCRVVIGN